MVTHAVPLAVERGKTTEVTVFGQQDFGGAMSAYVHGGDVTAEVTPSTQKATNVKMKITVAPSAALGPREFRIATTQGVSSVGQLVITDQPVVTETGEHSSREKAQPVRVGSTVAGTLSAREQIDVFRFPAAAGQQVTFEVCAARLMHKIHDLQQHFDPIMSLYDASGRELASNDDYYLADPMLSFRFQQPGDYFIAIRDVNFGGDARWNYALLITDRPYVTAVSPMALPPSGDRRVRAVGFGLTREAVTVPIPQPANPGRYFLPVEADGKRTNPVFIEVSALPLANETEPNNEPKSANSVRLPLGVTGRIDRAGDVDHFALDLKKGDSVRVEVKARRNGSELDSHLRLVNAKGSAVATSDDHKRTKDSLLVHSVAADGPYFLEVRDLLNRGGPTFGYYLELTRDEPDFELVCDDDKAGLGPGTAKAWFVKATRTGGFNGSIDVRVEGLPAGVSANPLTIPPEMSQGCLILIADAGAKPVLSPVRVVGRAKAARADGRTETIERLAQPLSEIYLPGGGRGVYEVDTHMVQVNPRFDLASVKVAPERVMLARNQSATLEVEIKRRESYRGPVTLDVRLRHLGSVYGDPLPPGVRVDEGASKTSLGPNDEKGRIVLRAQADAKTISNVPVAVMAHVSINFVVKSAYASRPVWLTVADPPKATAASR
jgi:hypothetical protein